MTSEQANTVYQRFRELATTNERHNFPLPTCTCGMAHGTVVGEGELKPQPILQLANPFSAPKGFSLVCMLCSGEIMPFVGEEEVLTWMDAIASILMYNDLAGLGVYAGAEGE